MLLQSLQIKGQVGQHLHFGLVRPQRRGTRRAHLTSDLHRTVRSECSVQTQSFFTEELKALTGVKIRYIFSKISKVLVVQSCSTLWDPMDYSPPGFSVHGILQARILEGVATALFRGSSQPRDWTQVSSLAGRLYTIWTTRKAPKLVNEGVNPEQGSR